MGIKTIYKPWGKEEWLELNERYCYKRIYINAGHKTSYQYHNFKRETNYIISGQAEIWLENDNGIVEKKIMNAGEYFNVTPPKKHRVIAITDIILQEVSTPEVDDVIRIEDDTHRPDGKIDSEHSKPVVLILAAGYGSRLKNLTDNINKVLLPINNKSIISHIIDKFPSDYDFVVALGYKGESIKEYLEITHPNHNITFETISTYEVGKSGPGLSALQCSKYLQRPFYFITGDCVIDSPIPFLDYNWIGVQETSFPEKYSTAQIDENDNVIKFSNKSENGFDYAFIGLGYIVDYKTFWSELNSNTENYEIINAFYKPKSYNKFKVKKLKWFDTGNLDDLIKTREYFDDKPLSLSKNTGEITYNDNVKFLKFVPNKELLNNRVVRAEHLNELVPENFNHSNNFLYYDWIDGKTLYEYDDYNVLTNFLYDFGTSLKDLKSGFVNDIQNFYVTKTKNRINEFIKKYGKKYYTESFSVNDTQYESLEVLFSSFDFYFLNENRFYEKFHGDLQFDNIIYSQSNDKFYYIDWRDSFGENVDMGDVYYDLSKMYGGTLIPYNKMKDENNIFFYESDNSVYYRYDTSTTLLRFSNILESWIKDQDFDLEIVKVITGLIYLNMSPLHDEKFGKMLWFKGIEILSEYDK